jgi:hypothetical protein
MNFGNLLHWAVVFLVVAIIAALLGFGGVANARRPQGRQVAYGSQFETPRDRALSAAQAIRCKLGGKDYISIDGDMPPKPKWMRWRTYERITQRCEAYEAICNLYLLGFLARLKNQR